MICIGRSYWQRHVFENTPETDLGYHCSDICDWCGKTNYKMPLFLMLCNQTVSMLRIYFSSKIPNHINYGLV
jgi:hypothetical protein